MIFMANGTTQLNQILYELFIDKSLMTAHTYRNRIKITQTHSVTIKTEV